MNIHLNKIINAQITFKFYIQGLGKRKKKQNDQSKKNPHFFLSNKTWAPPPPPPPFVVKDYKKGLFFIDAFPNTV